MMDDNWIRHWIMELVSDNTITNKSFEDWMWCPERYVKLDLDLMKALWDLRKSIAEKS